MDYLLIMHLSYGFASVGPLVVLVFLLYVELHSLVFVGFVKVGQLFQFHLVAHLRSVVIGRTLGIHLFSHFEAKLLIQPLFEVRDHFGFVQEGVLALFAGPLEVGPDLLHPDDLLMEEELPVSLELDQVAVLGLVAIVEAGLALLLEYAVALGVEQQLVIDETQFLMVVGEPPDHLDHVVPPDEGYAGGLASAGGVVPLHVGEEGEFSEEALALDVLEYLVALVPPDE